MEMKNLNASTIPLKGTHLIEASAGTGKTFNITRLYLRLLLERKLTVQQILVMTFTKDATEELKSRIEGVLREAIDNWQSLCSDDPFYRSLSELVDNGEIKLLLRQALLNIDEASIFTIHGFCKTVINNHAFSSGVSFQANLETDASSITKQCVQDWYRQLSADSPQNFALLEGVAKTPEKFIADFGKLFYRDSLPLVQTQEQVIDEYRFKVREALSLIEENKTLIFECIVDSKSGKEREKRIDEYEALVNWLSNVITDHQFATNKMPTSFFLGSRFSRHAKKDALKDAFAGVNQLKSAKKSIFELINNTLALNVIQQGLGSIKQAITAQKNKQNLLTFDDLIDVLARKVSVNNGSNELSNAIYRAFPVALVDEFQDTDSKQFSILSSVYFNQPSAGLFFIGDPKQAIYGFRGGDVFAYLNARKYCQYQWVMDTNWRSSPEVILGYNTIFESRSDDQCATFDYGIPYLPVKAAPNAASEIDFADDYKGMQFVHFEKPVDKPLKAGFRDNMARWCAQETARLIKSGAVLSGDIAFLVRDGTEGAAIKTALSDVGLVSVYLSDRQNLFKTNECLQLLNLLKGILYVEDERLFYRALSTVFMGYDHLALEQLSENEQAWQQLFVEFNQYRDTWRTKGFITMALKLMHDHITIIGESADRIATNLLHLFEILQASAQRYRQPQELLAWLDEQIHAEQSEVEAELRLESEANLIKIVTQHGSKGLEYPVVFVPFATRYKDPLKFGNKNISVYEYHNDQGDLLLSLDADKDVKQRVTREACAESVRLLYVAITRAVERCYILTAAFDKYESSPLGHTLKWSENDIATQLVDLCAANPEAMSVAKIEEVEDSEPTSYENDNQSLPVPAVFNGRIERDWWMSSFTALNRSVRQSTISGPERDVAHSDSLTASLPEQKLRYELTKGALSGNLLHDIMEYCDFSKPDWQASMSLPLARYGELPTPYQSQDLVNWLEQVLSAPLKVGPSACDFSLSSLKQEQTLREVEFYFPLENSSVVKLLALLNDHRTRVRSFASDNKRAFLPNLSSLKGMMHGFIDLVFEHDGKYYVADYKSTYLGGNITSYQHATLYQDIISHNYDLQYLIYSLALHRYLKSSIADYRVEQHFGGVFYFYLRGMNTSGTEGVYYTDILEKELNLLDAIFSNVEVDA